MVLKQSFQVDQVFTPARICEVELSSPLPFISRYDPARGKEYSRAIVLIRIHRQPIDILHMPIPEDGLAPKELANQIWNSLSGQLNEHLRKDELPQIENLSPLGISSPAQFTCSQDCEPDDPYPFVSVVVATRDRAESLARALDSIREVDYPNFEVVVVDNAPRTKATEKLIQERYASWVKYVREDRPGLAIAHNAGLKVITGQFVAFTDDDVIVDRDWLRQLVCGFNRTDRVACVTGMILLAELETPAQAIFEEYGGLGKGFTRRIFDLKENRPDNPLFPYAAGRYGSGANMAYRTDFLRMIGGFDPATGTGTPALGGDDLASFFEVISRGYRLVYEPAAFIYHHHRRDYGSLQRQAFGYGAGLTAYLTKTILDNPGRILDIVWRVPAGLLYILSPHSYKNRHKGPGYPVELNRAEYRGMFYGPIAYLRSLWQARKFDRNQG